MQPSRVKSRPSQTPRLAGRKGNPRGVGLPLGMKAGLAAIVILFGLIVLLNAPSVVGAFFSGVGNALGGVANKLSQTAAPSATGLVLPPSPSLTVPTQPYTNQPKLDLTGTIPNSIAGQPGYTVVVYRKIGTAAATQIAEIPVGSSPTFTVPGVDLATGTDAFTATISGAAGESPPSIAVTYILDQSKPKITISAPAKNAIVNGTAATITGQTQAGSAISARNEANSVTAVATADNTGAFKIVIALAGGLNGISITATDPAGNAGSVVISLQRGTGKLTIKLTASAYHFNSAKSNPITMNVLVLDPNGAILTGANVTLTLTVPGDGISPFSQQKTTASNGSAVFKTTIPATVAGKGEIAVIVDTTDYGQVTAQVALTFN